MYSDNQCLDKEKFKKNISNLTPDLTADKEKLNKLILESKNNPQLKNNPTYNKFLSNVASSLKEVENENIN